MKSIIKIVCKILAVAALTILYMVFLRFIALPIINKFVVTTSAPISDDAERNFLILTVIATLVICYLLKGWIKK